MSTDDSSSGDLVVSYFESCTLYARNLDRLWFYGISAGFRSFGALLSGRILQFTLATTDYFLRLKRGEHEPDANCERIMDLSHQQLGVDAGQFKQGMKDAMWLLALGAGIAVLGALVGSAVGALFGSMLRQPVLFAVGGCLVPLLLGTFIVCQTLAKMMLQAGLLIKFGPEEVARRRGEMDAIVRRHKHAFALYAMAAMAGSQVGLVLCCVGVFLTIPFSTPAIYVGMINTLGITSADMDKFLSA